MNHGQASFCIYKLLKRAVQYQGVEVLVPESWQLMPEHVSARVNTAELQELVKANPNSSYILVRTETASPDANTAPKILSLEDGLRLALATEAFLEDSRD